jgi:hypothetical protein
MAKIVFGNHSSVLVPRQDRYIAFLYGEVPEESEFQRSARSIWLEIKSDDVERTVSKVKSALESI